MKKRVFRMALGAAILAGIAAFLGGCDNGSTTETEKTSDEWVRITELSESDGTWIGSSSQSQTIQKQLETGGIEWLTSMELLFGNMEANENSAQTVIIDTNAKKMSKFEIVTVIFSGGNVAEGLVWTTLKGYLSSAAAYSGAAFDDTDHSVTYPKKILLPLTEDMLASIRSDFQITKDKKKLKCPANSNFLGNGLHEVIYTK